MVMFLTLSNSFDINKLESRYAESSWHGSYLFMSRAVNNIIIKGTFAMTVLLLAEGLRYRPGETIRLLGLPWR